MDKKIVIKVDHVSKKFNIYRKDIQKIASVLFGKEPTEVMYALDDVSFEVAKGDRINIFGVVGSGRTTLANILSGITLPSKGRVSVKGKVNAMLFAKAGMELELTCRDNVFLKANTVGLPKEKTKEIVDDVLEFSDLTDFADLPIKRASKGAPALLSLAVHLAADADVLIVDDVFVGGGTYVRTKCEDRLRTYLENHRDITMVMITNHLGYAKAMCPRSIVLDEGKVVFDGDTVEAVEIYKAIHKRTKAASKGDPKEVSKETSKETSKEISEEISAEIEE